MGLSGCIFTQPVRDAIDDDRMTIDDVDWPEMAFDRVCGDECGEGSCDDGFDGDGDEMTDCEDPECWDDPECGDALVARVADGWVSYSKNDTTLHSSQEALAFDLFGSFVRVADRTECRWTAREARLDVIHTFNWDTLESDVVVNAAWFDDFVEPGCFAEIEDLPQAVSARPSTAYESARIVGSNADGLSWFHGSTIEDSYFHEYYDDGWAERASFDVTLEAGPFRRVR